GGDPVGGPDSRWPVIADPRKADGLPRAACRLGFDAAPGYAFRKGDSRAFAVGSLHDVVQRAGKAGLVFIQDSRGVFNAVGPTRPRKHRRDERRGETGSAERAPMSFTFGGGAVDGRPRIWIGVRGYVGHRTFVGPAPDRRPGGGGELPRLCGEHFAAAA